MDRLNRRIAKIIRQKPDVWEVQILKQWEDSAKRGLFPYLSTDEHGVFAGARLTTFRSNNEWLIVFELPAYIGEADTFVDRIYTYGNKVKHRVQWIEFLCPSPSEGIDSEGWLPNLFDFEVLLHSKVRRFTPTQENYAQAGIDLNEPISSSSSANRQAQVLRLLTSLFPHEVFMSAPKLLGVIDRPKTLPLFLQMYEWYHPDLRSGERPGDSPCLRSLAHALAHNHPDLYRCSQNLFNTHWSHWPNYLKLG